jgi:flagellar assembly protein FliH
MPSSPDTTIAAWQPAELSEARHDVAPGASAPVPARPAPLFEVDAPGGVPRAVLDPARRAAESAGYAAGWAAGIAAARAVTDAESRVHRQRLAEQTAAARMRSEQAVGALEDAARALRQRSAPVLAELQELIASAAFAIAEAVVGASLADDECRGRAAVARALALVPDSDDVEVALHPVDLEALREAGAEVSPGVRLVPDADLQPGDAIARCAVTTIDARIAPALDRVRAVLGR